MAPPPDSVLLIQPQRSFEQGNVWRLINRCLPPLGLASLAAVLERNGIPVRILDTAALGLSQEEIIRRVTDLNPGWVGITSTTVEINHSLRLAALIKKSLPHAKIVFGGSHASALPSEVAAHPAVDAVVLCEGEATFLELVQTGDFSKVKGITYRQDSGAVVSTPPRPFLADLDQLPMPAYHLLPMKQYRPSMGNFRRLPAMSMVTTRGCPGRCTFCSTRGMGEKIRYRSAGLLADEIELLIKDYGIKEISFYDDTISWHKANFTRLLEEIIRRKLDISWSCMSRVDMVDYEMLCLMRRAGCHQVAYGVESSSPEILRNVKKNVDPALVPGVVRDSRRAGLNVRLMFMFGNPGETRETMADTLKFALSLKPDLYVFNITVPFPGTEMFAWAESNGYLMTRDWDQYDLSHAVLKLPTVSPEEIVSFYRHAYRSAYLSPPALLARACRSLSPRELVSTLHNARFLFNTLLHRQSHEGKESR
jgi:anaerobic magnesium-protoporphyrin IX monomethyl ester cyclase